MRLPKKKAKIVLDVVRSLEVHKRISPEVAALMRSNIEPIAFDWRRLARYSFLAALCCIVIAVVATFADEYVIALLTRFWNFLRQFLRMPIIGRSILVAAASSFLLHLGLKQRAKDPGKVYSNEGVFTIAAMGFACAIYLFCRSINVVDAWFVLAASSVLYLALGFWLESKLIWAYGILTASGALGNDVDYGWGCYCLGMDHPLRMVAFGGVLFFVAEVSKHSVDPSHAALRKRVELLWGVTRVLGLIHLFVALWILSIWGADWSYHRVEQIRWDLAWWSLAFGAAAVGAVVRALFQDDGVLRGFGLTFFFIELYTKFFEYFWEGLHKALFFAILAASFWLIGRKAEAMWKMKLPGRS